MANHKSAEKRHRQSIKRRIRNHAQRSAVRTAIKKTRTAAAAGNGEEARRLFLLAEKAIARAAAKGIGSASGLSCDTCEQKEDDE